MEKEKKCLYCGKDTTQRYKYTHFEAPLCSDEHRLAFHCLMSAPLLDDEYNCLIDLSSSSYSGREGEGDGVEDCRSGGNDDGKKPCFACGKMTEQTFQYNHFQAHLCSQGHQEAFHRDLLKSCLDEEGKFSIDLLPISAYKFSKFKKKGSSSRGRSKSPVKGIMKKVKSSGSRSKSSGSRSKSPFNKLKKKVKGSGSRSGSPFKKLKNKVKGSGSGSRSSSGSPLRKLKNKVKGSGSGSRSSSGSPLRKLKNKVKGSGSGSRSSSGSPLRKLKDKVKRSGSGSRSSSGSPLRKLKDKVKVKVKRSGSGSSSGGGRSKSPIKRAASLVKNPLRQGSGATSRTRNPFRGKKNTKSLNPIKRLSGSGKSSSSKSSSSASGSEPGEGKKKSRNPLKRFSSNGKSSKNSSSSSGSRSESGSKPLPKIPKKSSGSSSSSGSKPLPSTPKRKLSRTESGSESGSKQLPMIPQKSSGSSSSSGSKPLPPTPKRKLSRSESGSESGSKPLPKIPQKRQSTSGSRSRSGSGSGSKPLPKKKPTTSDSSSSAGRGSQKLEKGKKIRRENRQSASEGGSRERSRERSSSEERYGVDDVGRVPKKSSGSLRKLKNVAKKSGRMVKNVAQSGARTASRTVSKARSISPGLRPRNSSLPRSTSSESGYTDESGSDVSSRSEVYSGEDIQRTNSNERLSGRSSPESDAEKRERRERARFYEDRNRPQPAPNGEKPLKNNEGIWKERGGYGYGRGWHTRYRWFANVFTPSVYAIWYPHTKWEPYYILDDASIQQFERDFTLPPNSAYRINTRVEWPTNLPKLPKFKDLGINLGEVRYQKESLDEEERRTVMKVQHEINEKLSVLKLQYNTFVNRGYWPVPDLDREQFSWIHVIPQ